MEEDEIEQPQDELEDTDAEEEETDDADEGDGEEDVVDTDDASETEVEDEDAPAAVYLPQGEGPASVKLREALADPEISALLDAAMEEKVNRKLQAFGVSQASYAQAAAEHPEVFRKYGSKINMTLAMFPEAERHTRKSVDIATMLAVTEAKAGTPDFGRELMKLAQQLNGGRAAPKTPKAPIPAASRQPSPSSGVRAQAKPSRERVIDLIMKDAGVTRAEAEDLAKGGR